MTKNQPKSVKKPFMQNSKVLHLFTTYPIPELFCMQLGLRDNTASFPRFYHNFLLLGLLLPFLTHILDDPKIWEKIAQKESKTERDAEPTHIKRLRRRKEETKEERKKGRKEERKKESKKQRTKERMKERK